MPGSIVQLLLFVIVTGLGFYWFAKAVIHRYMYVKLGQPVDWGGRVQHNLREFAVQMFGQTKLLKDRKSGIMHIVIFYGFIILQLGALDMIYKGLVGHPLPLPGYSAFELLQELTIVAVLIAMGYAAYRRYGEKLDRLKRGWKPSLVVYFIFALMSSVLLTNAFQPLAARQGQSSFAPISAFIALPFAGLPQGIVEVLYVTFWWSHLLILLAFLVYVPQSKHFHLLSAPINLLLQRTEPPGRLRKLDLEDEEADSFGVGKIEDFTQKQLIDLYACVECGRCTNVCPAASTGKWLSPMHLIIKLRDHLTEKGAAVTSRSPWSPAFAFATTQTHGLQTNGQELGGWQGGGDNRYRTNDASASYLLASDKSGARRAGAYR